MGMNNWSGSVLNLPEAEASDFLRCAYRNTVADPLLAEQYRQVAAYVNRHASFLARLCVLKRYAYGMPIAEIAENLGVSERSVQRELASVHRLVAEFFNG